MERELADQMRLGMRRLASGVSIVTAKDEANNRLAMTASSVTSISDEPPSLLVCIHQNSYLVDAIRGTRVFCINLLSRDQKDISVHCASSVSEKDRFTFGEWERDENTGLHFLKGAQAVFICELVNEIEHGTHSIFLGDIRAVLAGSNPVDPLIYLNGDYLG